MSNALIVQMPYIKDLSVNHYLGRRKDGGYYVKQPVKTWKEGLGWKIKAYHIEDWKLPIHVTCGGVFRDKRSTPDLSNLSKVILDAIEDACGVNDQNYRWHDGISTIGDSEPYLHIIIAEEKE